MLKERTGRVTFMPLNRLHPKNPPLPSAQDAIPLLDKLRYDPAHIKAFQQVFGKTCVCRDLTVAAAYVKSHGINTITLDGDKVDRKGALTGGYHDIRRSRIEAVNAVTSWRAKFEAEDKRAIEVKQEMLKIEQEITRVVGRLQVLSNQQQQARGLRDALQADANMLLRRKEQLEERSARLLEDIAQIEGDTAGADARIDAYRAEIASPMTQNLSVQELATVDRLQKEVSVLQSELVDMSKIKNQVRNGIGRRNNRNSLTMSSLEEKRIFYK
jgi:structural maintenance of chromosome 3 (chondroitin sulfate proteoglycan 6)